MDIFSYTDYRVFLGDWFKRKKKQRPNFSYRVLAAKVGFRSAGFFTLILKGKSNISMEMAEGFSAALELKKSEREYFRVLVLYNQTKDDARRMKYWKTLKSLHKVHISNLTPDLYRFMEKWHHIAIRELLSLIRFRGDFKLLGGLLEPPIGAEEAESSVKLLLELGMIRMGAHGYYEKVDLALTTGTDAAGPLVENFFLAMHGLGGDALKRFPREQRNLSWLTLSISKERYEEIVEDLRNFRRDILQAAQSDSGPKLVYQMNFEVFPLTSMPFEEQEKAGPSG